MLRNNNKKRTNNDDGTPNINVNAANNNRSINYYANYNTVIYKNNIGDGAARSVTTSSSSAHAA
jgi:hypothetical protein